MQNEVPHRNTDETCQQVSHGKREQKVVVLCRPHDFAHKEGSDDQNVAECPTEGDDAVEEEEKTGGDGINQGRHVGGFC